MIKDALIEMVVLLAVIVVLTLLWRWVFGDELDAGRGSGGRPSGNLPSKRRLIWGGGSFLVGLIMVSVGVSLVHSARLAGMPSWGLLAAGVVCCCSGAFFVPAGAGGNRTGDVKLMQR